MYKIRFHLSKGKNFQKWQIKSPSGAVSFHEPSEVTIFMHGCKLHNQRNTAVKIYDGANKSVCAWVEAEGITIACLPIKNIMGTSSKISYNPRVTPNWYSKACVNLDGLKFDTLFTSQRNIIVSKLG